MLLVLIYGRVTRVSVADMVLCCTRDVVVCMGSSAADWCIGYSVDQSGDKSERNWPMRKQILP